MSQEREPSSIRNEKVVYAIPNMETVPVSRDITYTTTETEALTMDIYYPVNARREAPPPAVVFVLGYPDPTGGYKKMGMTVSWAQLVAASGLSAVLYSNRRPEADLVALLDFLRTRGASLGIDGSRIAAFAISGNGPLALSLLMGHGRKKPKCAVFSCGYTLDLDGSAAVAEAARTYGFVNPCAGKSVDDIAPDVPLFFARAGQDQFVGVNEALDGFVLRALARDLPVTLVNHAGAPHAFELFHDCEMSREIIRRMLAFLRFHLGA